MTAEKTDVLSQAFSCKDCQIRAYEDAIKEIRQARDDLQAELRAVRRNAMLVREVPSIELIEKVSGMQCRLSVETAYYSPPGNLVVVFRR